MILDVCNVPDVLKVLKIIRLVIVIIKIVVPIILIISCMLDYAKTVGNAGEIGDTNKLIVKKVIAAVLIFLIPTFVGMIVHMADPNGVSYIGCLNNATSEKIEALYQEKMNKLMDEARNKKDAESVSNAKNYLNNISDKELRNKYATELDNIQKGIDDKDSSSNPSNPGGVIPGKGYNLTDEQVRYLTTVCICEQPTINGIMAEASLMLNLYELNGSKKYSSVYDYVKNGTWFACRNNSESASSEQIAAVKKVLVDGQRTLPPYVNEHDCSNCNKNLCSNGNRGDICSIETNGKKYTSMSDIQNHSNYVSGKTIIHNKYGSDYTFYTFPCDRCDPFGYTASAYNKYK